MFKTATQFKCRVFEEKDMQGILNLWEQYSGWGSITEEQYYKWFINQPYGKSVIVVVEDENKEIIANTVFTPTKIFCKGQYTDALRASAPIIKQEARLDNIRSAEHLSFKMFAFATEIGSSKGFSLIYSFPARGWLTFFKCLPKNGLPNVITASFDCYAITIEDDIALNDTQKALIEPIKTFDDRFDKLWQESVTNFPINISVLRNKQWLNWKIGGHFILAFKKEEHSKDVMGYIALNKKTGLIVDVFARTKNEIYTIVLNTIKYLYKIKEQNSLPFHEIKIMKSPLISEILENPLFYKIDFKFAFAVYLLDKNADLNSFESHNWFMMPND